jgi:ATP-dependent DNA helicase PIF1
MQGEVYVFLSADRIVEDGGRDIYPPEYLNCVEVANLPHHELKIKIGTPVILLRNLNPSAGLCNGTRLRVLRCGQRVVEGEILGGKHVGERVFIPRIPLSLTGSAELPFEFVRVQLPLRLAFAMTINKSQGQPLNFVGVVIKEPVFSHGQLYVALSRVTCDANLHLVVPDNSDTRERSKFFKRYFGDKLLDSKSQRF